MSERSISAAYKTAVAQLNVLPVWFLFMDFLDTVGAAAPVRLCTVESGLTWDGFFWSGHMTGLMDISEISETTDGQSESISVILDAIPSAVMASITSTQYQGRDLKLWRGLRDTSTLAVIADPDLAFSGIMEQDRITDDGVISTLSLGAVSQLSNQLIPRVYRYTHNDQQLLWSGEGDDGLEFLAELQSVEIKWGQ